MAKNVSILAAVCNGIRFPVISVTCVPGLDVPAGVLAVVVPVAGRDPVVPDRGLVLLILLL